MGLGSGIRKNLFRIPDPGFKQAPDPGSRIRIRNTGIQLFTWIRIPFFYMNTGLGPVIHFNAGPDPAFHFDTDPILRFEP